jgi:hypothetical protein
MRKLKKWSTVPSVEKAFIYVGAHAAPVSTKQLYHV